MLTCWLVLAQRLHVTVAGLCQDDVIAEVAHLAAVTKNLQQPLLRPYTPDRQGFSEELRRTGGIQASLLTSAAPDIHISKNSTQELWEG